MHCYMAAEPLPFPFPDAAFRKFPFRHSEWRPICYHGTKLTAVPYRQHHASTAHTATSKLVVGGARFLDYTLSGIENEQSIKYHGIRVMMTG